MHLSGFHRLFPWWAGRPAEPSRLVVGSTGSGKSEGELVDLARLARAKRHAVVLLDGHGPLALQATGHFAAGGHASRIVYEPLAATDRVLCWHMLPRSTAPTASRRRLEDHETRDEVVQCFLAQRNLDTLADRPWTKEWLEAAIDLCLAQAAPEPLGSLLSAFQVGSAAYERLQRGCATPNLVRKFREMEGLRRRNVVQYELQTGPARRLLELVCGSEVVRLRSRPGPFDWQSALQEKKLIVFDGGGIRSKEIKRTLFLLASLQVIHAVRRHFAKTQAPLPVVLVLEEAGALGLVTPFILAALQELRKAGLAIHVITQSCADFGDRGLFEAVMANTPWQAWYQCLSPSDQDLGAKALTNATFDPHAVHFTRARPVQAGSERIETLSHGETTDAHGILLRRDRRTGMALRPRFLASHEPHYKTPQLAEQEYRTLLATLRVGERVVRDRAGVRRERVRRLRSTWLRPVESPSTHSLIDRLRCQPIYVPCPSEPTEAVAPGVSSAAKRLRSLTGAR